MRRTSNSLLLLLLLSVGLHAQDARQYLYNNAYTYQQRHSPDTAMVLLNILLSVDSSYLPAWNLKGYIHEEHYAQYDSARTCYQRVLSIDPLNIKGHINLAHLFYLERDYRSAKELLNKALTIDSTYGDLYYNLGYIANEQHDQRQAIAYMHKAIALGSRAALKWMDWYEEQQRIFNTEQ